MIFSSHVLMPWSTQDLYYKTLSIKDYNYTYQKKKKKKRLLLSINSLIKNIYSRIMLLHIQVLLFDKLLYVWCAIWFYLDSPRG